MSLTPNTGEGWAGLLGVLTEEELDQYGQLAQDQIGRELRWRWARTAAGILAATLIVWMGFRLFQAGYEGLRWFLLGLAALMVYWPYRSLKTQRLWQGHYDAVQDELSRRRQGD